MWKESRGFFDKMNRPRSYAHGMSNGDYAAATINDIVNGNSNNENDDNDDKLIPKKLSQLWHRLKSIDRVHN